MMINKKKFILVLFSLGLCFLTPSQAFGFDSWWQCEGRKGGEWKFARVPYVCLVNHMQKQSFVKQQYGSVVFDDILPRTSERKRYMTELNAVAKEISDYYIRRRKPNVSQTEVDAFTRGLLTLMHQETFWSHYRKSSDNNVRYMRGDVGHGHGIMQVDDRSHQNALLDAKGADLIQNVLYGLDVFFSNWQKAPSKSCVASPTHYTQRTRAAWAAYNGGPSRLCRWTSTTGPYAHHDKDFYSKFNNKQWEDYITDMDKASPLDIECLSEGQRPCAPPTDGGPIEEPVEGQLYKNSMAQYCVLKSNHFECVEQLNDVNCLQLREEKKYPNAQPLAAVAEQSIDKEILDRHSLCLNNVKGLIAVTSTLKLKKNINLRKTPAGELLTTLEAKDTYRSEDFAVTTTDDQKRYYKVKQGSLTGYFYAGDEQSYNQWAEEVAPDPDVIIRTIAEVGDTIKIKASNGINLRNNPDGKYLVRVPKNVETEVQDAIIRGSKNYVYYGIQYKGMEGYIYSGYIKASSTVSQWTQVLIEEPTMMLNVNISYRFLKQCPSDDCDYTDSAVKSSSLGGDADALIIQQSQGRWVAVESTDGKKSGWIKSSELQEYKN